MLKIIDIKEAQKWDNIVNSFKDNDVYWLSSYVEPFSIFEKSPAYLIYFEGKSTRLCYAVLKYDISSCPLFQNQLEKNKYFDIQTPYGYGGALVENYKEEDIEEFFKELNIFANENNIISQFLRFHPLNQNHRYFEGFTNLKTFKQTVFLDLKDEETIYKNLNDKCRNMVKKALKNEVSIKIDNSISSQENFKKLYKQTMDKNNADNFYYFDENFFNNVFKTLSESCDIFNAIYQGLTIASAIILKSKNFIHYHLSAQDRNYSKFGANNLLLFEVAKYYSNFHKLKFHLGGG